MRYPGGEQPFQQSVSAIRIAVRCAGCSIAAALSDCLTSGMELTRAAGCDRPHSRTSGDVEWHLPGAVAQLIRFHRRRANFEGPECATPSKQGCMALCRSNGVCTQVSVACCPTRSKPHLRPARIVQIRKAIAQPTEMKQSACRFSPCGVASPLR